MASAKQVYEDRRNKGLCGHCGAPALPETTINPAASLAMSEGRHVPAAYGRENLLGKPLARIRTLVTCAKCRRQHRDAAKRRKDAAKPKCTRCGQPTDRKLNGNGRYKTCATCRENDTGRARRRRAARSAAGLCRGCGKANDRVNVTSCSECSAATKQQDRARKLKRIEQGLCAKCGARNDNLPRMSCLSCTETERDRAAGRKPRAKR